MPKQSLKNKKSSGDTDGRAITTIADRLLNALTQQEMAQLVDALFEVLSPALHLSSELWNASGSVASCSSTAQQPMEGDETSGVKLI